MKWLSPGIRPYFAAAAALLWTAAVADEPVKSLAALREAVSRDGRLIRPLHLEGTVCALNSPNGWLVLKDGTGAEALEVAQLPEGIAPGSAVTLDCEACTLTRGGAAIQLGTAPVVEIDGFHPAVEKTGEVFLRAGMQPLRIEWFNGLSDVALEVEIEGPGMVREKIGEAGLFHTEVDAENFLPGLQYESYEGPDWIRLPDFRKLTPLAKGVAHDLDLSLRSRPERSGLVFHGDLRVPVTGRYLFHLRSDDGGRVFAGDPHLAWKATPGKLAPAEEFDPASVSRGNRWVHCAGTVSYAAKKGQGIDLELEGEGGTVPVMLADAGGWEPGGLLRKAVDVTGITQAGEIVVIDPDQVKITTPATARERLLTQAADIRRLKSEDASKPLKVDLQGVVTMVNAFSLVLQDASGGIFVHWTPAKAGETPQVGEVWRIGGVTGPGDFSPVVHAQSATYLRKGDLPRPVQPSWEQLLSGNLDAEEVEIEGVVVRSQRDELSLLTRDGVVRIASDGIYPLPTLGMGDEAVAALNGSVVRLRGVYASSWDRSIGRVHPAELKLGSATLAIDQAAPSDWFETPVVRATDLLGFTSQSRALERVKVKGVVLATRALECFLSDDGQSLRIYSADAGDLRPGDVIEAVGFPRPGAPSPFLLEAKVRKTGEAALPAAKKIGAGDLPDAAMDSTRVAIEAEVLSDSVRQNERAIELRAGAAHFFAYLPATGSHTTLERGSLVKLTGVYASTTTDRSAGNLDAFELRLPHESDVVVTKRGPWWTPARTIIVVSILSGSLILAAIWVTVLRRTVARRSRELAREIEEREAEERRRMMETERTRVAQDLHDELGSGLTEAGILSALLKNPAISPEAKKDYLEQLSAVCFSLVTGLDEIVWAVNPRYDSVADLAGYFSLFAQRFLGLANIRCRLNIDDAIPSVPLDSRRRHGIFLAVKEALNNVVRHSGATEVRLAIAVAGEMLRIELADDGSGFDPREKGPGSDGVSGMERRMEQLGGDCRIASSQGHGTTIRFNLPLETATTSR